MQFVGAVLFAAVFAWFIRSLITKIRKRPPAIAVPHVVSCVAVVILYPLLDGEGPFAHGTADVIKAIGLYVPAQFICFLFDWTTARS